MSSIVLPVVLIWTQLAGARSLLGALPRYAPVEILAAVSRHAFNLPLTSISPGFSFRYDPIAGEFERAPLLASLFAEQADTIGAGRFDVGASVVYAKLGQLNGKDLTTYRVIGGSPDSYFSSGFRSFSLEGVRTLITGTYGITSNWDVNLLIPLVHTHLSTRIFTTRGDFGSPPATTTYSVNDDAFGIGDVALRSKLHLLTLGHLSTAVSLALQFPTGNGNDFRGTGDFLVTPTLIAGYAVGPHDVHLNAGVECDAKNSSRSRARYAAGASLQVLRPLAFLIDVIGASEFYETRVPFVRAGAGRHVVDLSMVFEANVLDHAVAYAGVLLPLTNDGLRANVLPLGGVQIPF